MLTNIQSERSENDNSSINKLKSTGSVKGLTQTMKSRPRSSIHSSAKRTGSVSKSLHFKRASADGSNKSSYKDHGILNQFTHQLFEKNRIERQSLLSMLN